MGAHTDVHTNAYIQNIDRHIQTQIQSHTFTLKEQNLEI